MHFANTTFRNVVTVKQTRLCHASAPNTIIYQLSFTIAHESRWAVSKRTQSLVLSNKTRGAFSWSRIAPKIARNLISRMTIDSSILDRRVTMQTGRRCSVPKNHSSQLFRLQSPSMFHGDETLRVISIVLLGQKATIYDDDGPSGSVGWAAERKRCCSVSRKPGPEASRVNGRLSDCMPRTRIDKNDCRPFTRSPFDYVHVGLRVDSFRTSVRCAALGIQKNGFKSSEVLFDHWLFRATVYTIFLRNYFVFIRCTNK